MTDHKFVLRVLSGRLAGSEVPINADAPLTIGHGFDNAVVLRDASTGPVALTFVADTEGGAWIEMREGAVELLGQTIAAPGRALLPPYIPLKVGAFTLAWGGALSTRWDDALALAGARPPALVPVDAVLATNLHDLRPPRTMLQRLSEIGDRFLNRSVYVTGGAVLTMLLLAPPLVSALTQHTPPVDTVRAAIAGRYPGLSASTTPTGDVLVTGTVPAEADKGRIEAMIARAGVGAQVSVQSGEGLADAAAQVFRDNGVPAHGVWLRDGVVRLTTGPVPAETRARLTNVAQGDVPGLIRLEVSAPDAGPLGSALAGDAAAKRVASVVAGDPGYITTADGARYFPGGLLPTGQRLVSIAGREITLERGGATTRLIF